MPKPTFPTAERISPVFVIDGALYTRLTAGAAMQNPEAIRAMVAGSDRIERVGWFVAALEATEQEETEQTEEGSHAAPKIAEAG